MSFKKGKETIRESFSAADKLVIIDYALQHSQTKASIRYGIHKSMVSRWLKDYVKIKNAPAASKRISDGPRVKRGRSNSTISLQSSQNTDLSSAPSNELSMTPSIKDGPSFSSYRRRNSVYSSSSSSSAFTIYDDDDYEEESDEESFTPVKRKIIVRKKKSFVPEISQATGSLDFGVADFPSSESTQLDAIAESISFKSKSDQIQDQLSGLDLLAGVSVEVCDYEPTGRYRYVPIMRNNRQGSTH